MRIISKMYLFQYGLLVKRDTFWTAEEEITIKFIVPDS